MKVRYHRRWRRLEKLYHYNHHVGWALGPLRVWRKGIF